MKGLLLVFSIVILLGNSSSTINEKLNTFKLNEKKINLDDWKTYRSDEGKCQISFPMEYKVEKKNDQVIVECIYGTQIFMFFHSHVKGAVGTDANLADKALQAFNKSMKGKIKKENVYNFNEFKGKKAVIYVKNQKLYAHYIVIVGQEILYQLVGMISSEEPNENVKKFFDSFVILK